MRKTVAFYYWLIRSILKDRPELRKYLKKCRHCRILFFTDPRNAARNDLGCPFGCREAHKKRESDKRSVEYNRSKEGKKKKAGINNKRGRKTPPPGSPAPGKKDTEKYETSQDILICIQIIIRLIHGYMVSFGYISNLIKKMRQHSMDYIENSNYQCSRAP